MSERFEIYNPGWNKLQRKDDARWNIFDNKYAKDVAEKLTKSQAETIKKALDEALLKTLGGE